MLRKSQSLLQEKKKSYLLSAFPTGHFMGLGGSLVGERGRYPQPLIFPARGLASSFSLNARFLRGTYRVSSRGPAKLQCPLLTPLALQFNLGFLNAFLQTSLFLAPQALRAVYTNSKSGGIEREIKKRQLSTTGLRMIRVYKMVKL